jgi:hypothetical protein
MTLIMMALKVWQQLEAAQPAPYKKITRNTEF